MTKTVLFERKLADGSIGRLGSARLNARGWKFYPAISGRDTSRKFHATIEACLPRWLNYPDGCESREIPAPAPRSISPNARAIADRVDGYDRDDIGESPDY